MNPIDGLHTDGQQAAPNGGAMPMPQMPSPPQGGQMPQVAPHATAPAAPVKQPTIDDVMELLRSTALRRFRIDIETDSTISGDESQERQDRQGLITSLTQMVSAWGPIVQAQPVMANLASELMMFGVRSFRVGRTLEETIQETVDKLSASLGQPKPPPQPSPDELVKLEGVKAKTQAEVQRANSDMQRVQMEGQLAQMNAAIEAQKMKLDAQMRQMEHASKTQADQMRAEIEASKMMMGLQHDKERHEMAKEHAEIAAKTKRGNDD